LRVLAEIGGFCVKAGLLGFCPTLHKIYPALLPDSWLWSVVFGSGL